MRPASTRRTPHGLRSASLQPFHSASLGQHCPSQCPEQPGPNLAQPVASVEQARLGPPLNIREIAELIGCSPWTVRQKLIPKGLPHFRLGASDKLIFYTNQVVRWIQTKQKGG